MNKNEYHLVSDQKDQIWMKYPEPVPQKAVIWVLVFWVVFSLLVIFEKYLRRSIIEEIPPSIMVDVVNLPNKVLVPEMIKPDAKIVEKIEEKPIVEKIKVEDTQKSEIKEVSQKDENEDQVSLNEKKVKIEKVKPKNLSVEDLRKNALKKVIDQSDSNHHDKLKNVKEENTRLLQKGNLISQGDSMSGAQQLLFDSYYSELKAHIHANWSLPPFLQKRKELKVVLFIKIGLNGEIIDYYIEKSSEVPRFDRETLIAVEKSKPLPVPPDKIAQRVLQNGINLIMEP